MWHHPNNPLAVRFDKRNLYDSFQTCSALRTLDISAPRIESFSLFFSSPFREAVMRSKVNGQTDCHPSVQDTTLSPSRHSNVKKVTGVGGTTYEISVWERVGLGTKPTQQPPLTATKTSLLQRRFSSFYYFCKVWILTNQGHIALPALELLSNQRTSLLLWVCQANCLCVCIWNQDCRGL